MTSCQAKETLRRHAGNTENVADCETSYVFALRYGFSASKLAEMKQKFDEIAACLKTVQKEFSADKTDRQLLADLQQIQYQSILYCNTQPSSPQRDRIQIYSEVLAETLTALLYGAENPFEAYENYQWNYDL